MNRPSYGLSADEPRDEQPRPTYGYSYEGADGDTGSRPVGGTDGADPHASGDEYPTGDPYATGADASDVGRSDDDRSGAVPRSSAAPTCPRHPDRVAYVRCQRCDRPACPECQRPAAVGVRCVDCERAAAHAQASARPRNAMGGSMGRRTPFVTFALLGLCGLFFLGQTLAPGLVEGYTIFGPYRALAMPWTFITSGFLHAGVMHLLLNGWAIWVVGQYLEQTMGHARFAALFLISVIAGHTAVLLFADPNSASWVTHTLGASGGVFGLFGSLFIVNRRMGAETGQVLVLLVLNLLITFMVPGISWEGHVGGLVVGTAMTAAMFAMRPTARPGADRVALARRAALMHTGVFAAGLLVCVAAIVAKVLVVGVDRFAMW